MGKSGLDFSLAETYESYAVRTIHASRMRIAPFLVAPFLVATEGCSRTHRHMTFYSRLHVGDDLGHFGNFWIVIRSVTTVL